MVNVVRYSSNNSGGEWWLTDEDWKKLEQAGWEVEWIKDSDLPIYGGEERFLGALAVEAKRVGLDKDDAITEWEDITGKYAWAEGCSCCGRPHDFWEREEEEIIEAAFVEKDRIKAIEG